MEAGLEIEPLYLKPLCLQDKSNLPHCALSISKPEKHGCVSWQRQHRPQRQLKWNQNIAYIYSLFAPLCPGQERRWPWTKETTPFRSKPATGRLIFDSPRRTLSEWTTQSSQKEDGATAAGNEILKLFSALKRCTGRHKKYSCSKTWDVPVLLCAVYSPFKTLLVCSIRCFQHSVVPWNMRQKKWQQAPHILESYINHTSSFWSSLTV